MSSKMRDLQCPAREERHTYGGGARVQGTLGWRKLREMGLGRGWPGWDCPG